jgi:hypothetical protein
MTGTPAPTAQHAWPRQAECDACYGDPRGGAGVNRHWEAANLVYVDAPFILWYELNAGKHVRVPRVYVHRKVADSLSRVFASVLAAYEHMDKASYPDHSGEPLRAGAQHLMDAAGVSDFDGSFCYRIMRGGSHLSMHSYGIALDFNAAHNPFGYHGLFKPSSPLVMAFEAEGWTWGGRWAKPDGMHFQAARV